MDGLFITIKHVVDINHLRVLVVCGVLSKNMYSIAFTKALLCKYKPGGCYEKI